MQTKIMKIDYRTYFMKGKRRRDKKIGKIINKKRYNNMWAVARKPDCWWKAVIDWDAIYLLAWLVDSYSAQF